MTLSEAPKEKTSRDILFCAAIGANNISSAKANQNDQQTTATLEEVRLMNDLFVHAADHSSTVRKHQFYDVSYHLSTHFSAAAAAAAVIKLCCSPFADCLHEWFPNCGTCTSGGTRRPSRWYTSVVYFPCWFLKMAIILSHSHFLHVAFVSIPVLQTFDRMYLLQ